MKIVVCSEHIKVNYFIVSNQMMLWLETNDKKSVLEYFLEMTIKEKKNPHGLSP